MMATLHDASDGTMIFAKGASEVIIDICPYFLNGNMREEFSKELKDEWLRKTEEEASNGLKVIAFAAKENKDRGQEWDLTALTFLGIAGLIDPPRNEVPEAIRNCHEAGINVVMITGDHPSTARNIAHQLAIISHSSDTVIQGSSMPPLNALTETQKSEWRSARVFARVSPAQKLDLINLLQDGDNIVAMTGDGINDAPALKKADIGIAMGLRGTDVAKEVADMVLKDDSLLSIVEAIKEGRIIFENIRKFLMYLLSSNLSEIFVIAVLIITNLAIMLTPLQILFINLLSDVFPALALGLSSGSHAIMNRPPRHPKKPLLSNSQWMSVIVYAIILAFCSLMAALLAFSGNQNEHNMHQASTALFYTLIVAQLLHVFSVAEHRQALFKTDIFRNLYVWGGVLISLVLAAGVYFIPITKQVLQIADLDLRGLLLIASCGFASFAIIQGLKRMHLIH
jgi:Ca2+-transporting ATPase